jgi:HSP20 family protein
MTSHEEVHGFPSLRREVESIFGEVLGAARQRTGSSARWSPTLDLIEEPGRYVIEMDVPGVRLEDLSINVAAGRRLVVSGRREIVREREDPSVRVRERWSGSFSRSLELPDEVDESRISAALHEGILRIELPRRGGRR